MNSTIGALVLAATDVFEVTTGCSQNVLSVYANNTGNPELLKLALTPENVCLIVNKENEASCSLPQNDLADRAAQIFTPLRRLFAHSASLLIVTGQESLTDNPNPYAVEAHLNLTSGTF